MNLRRKQALCRSVLCHPSYLILSLYRECMAEYVMWDEDRGRPVAATDAEAERLAKREDIIDGVLQEMGYEDGIDRYQEYIQELRDSDEYMEFLEYVDDIADDLNV